MRPPGDGGTRTPIGRTTHFTLETTMITREKRSAVINGHLVGVGDTVDGARVLSIDPSRVQLQFQGQQITVQLLPLTVKQPRTTE